MAVDCLIGEIGMNQEVWNIVMMGFVTLNTLIALTALALSAKLFKMHNVRNTDGTYAFMVPDAWAKLPEKITRSQELIVSSVGELSAFNKQNADLQKSMIDALMKLHERLRKD